MTMPWGGILRRRPAPVWLAAATLIAACAVFAAGHAATEVTELLRIRLGGDVRETRLVIELSGAARASVLPEAAGQGSRLVLLLPGVRTVGVATGAGRGLVKTWTLDHAQGGARLQIDLATEAIVRRRFLLPPADGVDTYRYVVDVAPAPGAVLTAAAMPAASAPQLRPRFAPPRDAGPAKRVVVIDAGHGGRDSGAQGAHGFEKDINLAAALSLAGQLERSGRYRVVLTRRTDVYIPLESRVRIAQRAGADLFISLHSDSGPQADLKGVSVYTLSDKASQRAQRFVSREDWFMQTSLGGDQGVRNILFDLTQRSTRNRSAVFAQGLLTRIDGRAPLLRRSHRDAGFMVLLAPDVPAVLLEMGFVSNPDDEARLRDPASRNRLMQGVSAAIDDHFSESLKLASR